MAKRVLIYPFGKKSEYIVKYKDMLNDLSPVCLVGLRGWDNGQQEYAVNDQTIPLVYDFAEGIHAYHPEVIWFVEYSKKYDFETVYLPYIKMAVGQHKKIIMSDSLKKMVELYSINNLIEYYPAKEKRSNELKYGSFLNPINTPVVYLCGLYGDLCGLELQLMIREQLLKKKISFCQIGTNDTSEEFGFYNVPWFVLEDTFSDKDKTLMLNRYIKEIEESEKPDIIVVGIPEELFAASDKYVAGFGYLAKDYFYAVCPDVVVMALPYEGYLKNDLDYISRQVQNRYGVKADVFYRTNKKLLLPETELEQNFSYLIVNKDDTKDIANIEHLYDWENEEENLVQEILNILSEYGKIESI